MTEGLTPSVDNDIAAILRRLSRKRKITAVQVEALRASELGQGLRSLDEAEALLAIERGGAETCRSWGEFLVEAILDFLVWDESPVGSLSEERAIWLVDQVGERPTPACMALLVAVVEEAHGKPAWFPHAVRLRATKILAEPVADARGMAA